MSVGNNREEKGGGVPSIRTEPPGLDQPTSLVVDEKEKDHDPLLGSCLYSFVLDF